jgi:hypothetical protein
MNVRDAWRSAFPQQSAREVVAYVVNMWDELAAKPSEHFGWHLNEPDITKRFKQRLEDGSDAAGFTGAWMAENVSMVFARSGAPRNVNRTDIVYFSDLARLRLTFEFKKLTDSSDKRKAYYGQQGMGRFLSGIYSPKHPFGIMVAIIEDDADRTCVNKLKRRMRDPEVNSLVDYIPDAGTGEWLREPSGEMPGLADFDTQHTRTDCAFQTFMFSHLVLPFHP